MPRKTESRLKNLVILCFCFFNQRSIGRAIEFLVGLFLLCNSAFILIFESGGAIRAVLVGLHAYFNLWCEARAGWNVFNRRRTASEKISVLETVTAFDDIDDVCAICFNELKPSTTNEVKRHLSFPFSSKIKKKIPISFPEQSGHCQSYPMPTPFPRCLPAQVALRTGSVPNVPPDPLAQDTNGQRRRRTSAIKKEKKTTILRQMKNSIQELSVGCVTIIEK